MGGLFEKLKRKAVERKQAFVIGRARGQAERQRLRGITRVAERESFEKEAIVQAGLKGRERAKRPTGLAGFAAGVGQISSALGKLAPPPATRRAAGKRKKGKRKGKSATRRIPQQPKQPSMLNYRF